MSIESYYFPLFVSCYVNLWVIKLPKMDMNEVTIFIKKFKITWNYRSFHGCKTNFIGADDKEHKFGLKITV